MGDQYWEVTAQMFGALFDKPKMTEKLLSKPPFKYLFDIITQTTKSTGFGKGLFKDDEQSADFYDTKEKKIYFLRKVIALSGAMLKEEIEAKPNKIVAGVEPDKTNLFLQAMYRAATCGEDSGAYVKKINAKFAKEEAETGGAPQEDAKQEEPPKEEPKRKPKEEPKEEPKPKERAPKEEPKPKKAVEEPKQKEPAPTQTKAQQRPGSAAKRDKSNVEVVETNKRGQGTSGIIKDDEKKKEEEDFFEEKTQAQSRGLALHDAGKHGKLVNEAVKELQQEEVQKEEKPQQGGIKMKKRLGKPTGAEPTGQRTVEQKESTGSSTGAVAGTSQNEVETIQKLIQNLTQNINPLRKSIDFINDDIESMNKEMESWRNNFLGSKAKYQQEQANTEEQLQPLQNKLAELEEQIKDKKFKIQAAKSHILQNEQRIQKLLYSVVSNK